MFIVENMSERIEPFEKYTQRYEEWFERNHYAYRSELKSIKKLLPDFEKGIEIGVGSGRFAGQLDIETGIDPSLKMLKVAEKRGINVIKGVGEHLPLKDESFDLALVVTTICFFEDVGKSLKEIHDILRNDGNILIGFVDRESQLGMLYQEKKEKNVFYKKATFYSTKEVTSLLKDVGFTQIETAQTLFNKPSSLNKIDKIKSGTEDGSFVVLKAKK